MPNCTSSGRAKPSCSRMRAMSSLVALLPAITAAGSPGVSRRITKTITATTTSTGTTAIRRWARKRSTVGEPSVLLDVPVDLRATRHEPGDVVAQRGRVVVLAERHVGRGLESAQLQLLGELLLLGVGRGLRELALEFLHRLVVLPAEPALVAGRVHHCHREG